MECPARDSCKHYRELCNICGRMSDRQDYFTPPYASATALPVEQLDALLADPRFTSSSVHDIFGNHYTFLTPLHDVKAKPIDQQLVWGVLYGENCMLRFDRSQHSVELLEWRA